MPHLPLNIDIRGKRALVVGAGSVATRKVMTLVDAGAAVTVVAPDASSEITSMAADCMIQMRPGTYDTNDLQDVFLVVAATNDRGLNRRIAEEALQRGLLVSVASEPETGNITFPALLRRGDLEISVSTNGTYPGYSAMVRDTIAGIIGEEYGTVLETLATERYKLLTEGRLSNYNNQILRSRARELLIELEHKERVP